MKILFSVLFALSCSWVCAQFISQPSDTRLVVTGVLNWQDPAVSSFSVENRKDQELFTLLESTGIPDSMSTLLLDENATLERMNKAIRHQMKSCTENSTFVFYYAGHGNKIGSNYYFCNYDMGKAEKSMFNVNTLSDYAKLYFKGKRIILMADCCYSGSLLQVGDEISKQGIEVIVLTSATSSNISTGNWTFTQTMLDMLRGDQLADRDRNGKISLQEGAQEIKDAMKYREYQLSGFASYGVDPALELIGICPDDAGASSLKSPEELGTYVYAIDETGNWRSARIVGGNQDALKCAFYNYSVYEYVQQSKEQVRTAYFPVYKVGAKVDVEWEGSYYPAEIVKTDDAFMYIHYAGYDTSFDEWVMYDRVRTGNEKTVSIEWQGQWYPGKILVTEESRYFITYDGYAHTWDEWVEIDRVK